MDSFRALRVTDKGGYRASLENITLDQLPPGEVLLKAHYSSVNYKDALALTGQGKILRSLPMIPGIDVAGVVLESKDARYRQGDEVLVTGYGLGQDQDGGYSEYVRVPADWVIGLDKDLSQGLSLYEAMALGTAGFTAGLAIQKMLDNGQTPDNGPILVSGASGGVGSVAINCLSQLGFEVVALTGKAQAKRYLLDLGATSVLLRQDLQLGEKPLEKSLWGGALDTLGGHILSWMTRSVARHGNIASCGLAAGIEINTTVMPFILRGINLLGIDSATCPMAYRKKVWQRLASDMKPSCLDKIVHSSITLEALNDVANKMIADQTTGRYIVKF